MIASKQFPCLVSVLAVALTTANPAFAADNIVLQLNWAHQAEYAGYYVAQENGYYADEDLAVEIRAATPTDDVPALLAAGDADVAVEFMAAALFAREQGAPMVNIAQPFKDAGLDLVCRRDSGIRLLDDLRGKRIGHAPGEGETVEIRALLTKLDITPKSGLDTADFNPKTDVRLIEFENAGYGIKSGIADCIPWYSNAKGFDALGFRPGELAVFSFKNLGVGMLGGGLWVLQDKLRDAEFKDAMARFTRATMKGWRWASSHQAETVSIVLKTMGAGETARFQQTNMLRAMVEQMDGSNGTLEEKDYQRTVDILLDGGILGGKPQNAWTSDITDRANLYAGDRFDRLLTDIGEWGKTFLLTLIDPRSTLVHIGWMLLVVSMLMRHALMVRVFVICSTLTFAATDLFVRFDYASLSWSLLIVLAGLWTELSDGISSKFKKFTLEEDNFRINELPGLSRANCRKLFNKGQWGLADEDIKVTDEGRAATHVYYICGGGITYARGGSLLLHREAPLVTSLVPFVDTDTSILTTTIEKGSRYWEIEASALRELLQDNQDIKDAVNSMAIKQFKKYGRSMTNKVIEMQTQKPGGDKPRTAKKR